MTGPILVSPEVLIAEMVPESTRDRTAREHPELHAAIMAVDPSEPEHDVISLSEMAEWYPIVEYPPYTDAEQQAGFREWQDWDGSAPYGLGT